MLSNALGVPVQQESEFSSEVSNALLQLGSFDLLLEHQVSLHLDIYYSLLLPVVVDHW